MRSKPSSSKLMRIIVAFSMFVAVLSTMLYFGFEKRRQPTKIKKVFKSSNNAAPRSLPYHTIGNTKQIEQLPAYQADPKYTLEFQIFRDRSDAEKLVNNLIEQGVQAYYTPLQRQGEIIYRVRKGVFESKQLALKAADSLQSDKKLNSRVIRLQ